jgi:hypothetical protein
MGTTDDRDSLFLRRTPPAARPEDVVAPSEEALGEPAGLYVDPADRPALVASRPRRWVGPIVVALAIVVTYAGWRALQTVPSPPPVVAAPEPTPPKRAPEVAQQPAVKYPLPDALSGAKPDVSLPSLADSDAVPARRSFRWLRTQAAQPVAADRRRPTHRGHDRQPPRSKAPWKPLPVTPPSGASGRRRRGTRYDRCPQWRGYAPYMLIVAAVDPKELASVYGAYYPLLQEQYRALGYPAGNFNDRVIEAIDDMLAAPVPATPPALTQPKVLYEFADPDLEARSAGQKMMLRLGAADAAKVKAKLRAIRKELAAAGPPDAESQGK